ncbi:PREDICTED: probable G-protein coupled receptor 157 [Amphimedon queenslandica]|uniref:G-protein coupled receptors family 2 profile 2 domain-containing protein n=1 Tax=Amphimedon queenslandica TaxID=400682 RepID=A0A1X7UI47_AMPQE|nr:PREDICTED: probable G-protein coupled receptor 157 [Amphimedon queenslandica]|eukprot:XP_011405005.1 PREDICTED: probable G-protein coupled receptor 157 [Amphimedon queenslandica]
MVNGSDVGPASFPSEKHLLVRTTVMIVCSLSMIGAIFVILSYVCFKSLRSQARQILVNLSLMDFGIGAANFFGAIINFDQYYKDMNNGTVLTGTHAMDSLCKTQAFIALLTTYCSVFWTTSLAVYMYSLVFLNLKSTKKMRLCLPACYVLCYGLGIGLSIWLILTNRLGHSPYNSSGWCSIIIISPGNKNVDFMAAVFGYDLWIYLTFFICAVVYPILILQMNIEFKGAIQLIGSKAFWKKALEFLNFKLFLIPIAFLLLRIWSCIVNIVFVYCGVDPDSLPHWVSMFLIIMSGIGDSGQGLANGLIFVFLTSSVRDKFLPRCLKKCKHTIHINAEERSLVLSSDKLDEEARRVSPNSIVTPTSSLY